MTTTVMAVPDGFVFDLDRRVAAWVYPFAASPQPGISGVANRPARRRLIPRPVPRRRVDDFEELMLLRE